MNKAEELARLVKRTRKQIGLNGDSQQQLLRKVREAFELSNDELASALDVPLSTLLAYLTPESAKKYRKMPDADALVLARILADRRKLK